MTCVVTHECVTLQVLKCLVEKFKDASDACQNEMSRAVRFALWDYGEGAPLTAVCDADIPAVCPKVRRRSSSSSSRHPWRAATPAHQWQASDAHG
jgi:hypothetical protein